MRLATENKQTTVIRNDKKNIFSIRTISIRPLSKQNAGLPREKQTQKTFPHFVINESWECRFSNSLAKSSTKDNKTMTNANKQSQLRIVITFNKICLCVLSMSTLMAHTARFNRIISNKQMGEAREKKLAQNKLARIVITIEELLNQSQRGLIFFVYVLTLEKKYGTHGFLAARTHYSQLNKCIINNDFVSARNGANRTIIIMQIS